MTDQPAIAERLAALVRDFLDPDPCRLDHHGYCQAHGWLCKGRCPHARAREVLAEYDAVPAPVLPLADRAALRDRIRRAVCEAEGFAWDSDMLEPDEYGDHADMVLAALIGSDTDLGQAIDHRDYWHGEAMAATRRIIELEQKQAACPDPIECSHEAALGEAQQQVRRLGLMVDEYGQGASALTDKLKRARDMHRETCLYAKGQVPPTAFTCSMCEVLDQPALLPAPAGQSAVLLREAERIARMPEASVSALAKGITWTVSELRRLAAEARGSDTQDDAVQATVARVRELADYWITCSEPGTGGRIFGETLRDTLNGDGPTPVFAVQDADNAIVAALQAKAQELSDRAEQEMRRDLEDQAQVWHDAADVARRAARKSARPAAEAQQDGAQS